MNLDFFCSTGEFSFLILWFQRQVLQTETDKEKVETDILRHAEKTNMLQVQVDNAQKDKENLQNEMEILLDRINKLSELVDKSRVNICRTEVCRECISLNCYYTILLYPFVNILVVCRRHSPGVKIHRIPSLFSVVALVNGNTEYSRDMHVLSLSFCIFPHTTTTYNAASPPHPSYLTHPSTTTI